MLRIIIASLLTKKKEHAGANNIRGQWGGNASDGVATSYYWT